jgi:hypothetical protein
MDIAARPERADAARNRQAILAAAIAMFDRDGARPCPCMT